MLFLINGTSSRGVSNSATRNIVWGKSRSCLHRFFLSTSKREIPATRTRIHPEVQHAISTNQPIVALESTIVAHGMPYPKNYQVAMEVESIVRSKGVVPATIAIRNGVCCIGLSSDQLHDLAKTGRSAMKCTTRDLTIALTLRNNNNSNKNVWGATTVASTAYLAFRNNITTFVTGGIGGVHRGNDNMDISADLIELSRTPVVVVSTGIKSLLDIPKTLEYLETFGVPVVTYGTDYLPTFFSTSASINKMIKSPHRIDTPQEAAELYWSARALGLPSGMLVAVPNPQPISYDNSPKDSSIMSVEDAIQYALSEVASLGIQGKDVTPFVLQSIAKQTGGNSLISNIALIRHNASVGADIAIAISAASTNNRYRHFSPLPNAASSPSTRCPIETPITLYGGINDRVIIKTDVIVMGGAVVDLVAKPSAQLVLNTSNIGTSIQCDGGVGRNIAEVLGRLGANPLFYSAVGGKDTLGETMIRRLQEQCRVQVVVTGTGSSSSISKSAVICDGATLSASASSATVVFVEGACTATCVALLSSQNELHAAIAANMEIFDNIPIPSLEQMERSKFLILDANPPIATLLEVAKRATSKGVCVVFEPTSVPKARRLGGADNNFEFLEHVTYATPNVDELLIIASTIAASSAMDSRRNKAYRYLPEIKNDALTALLESVQDACSIVLPKMNWQTTRTSGAHLIVTLGEHGVLHASMSIRRTALVETSSSSATLDIKNACEEEQAEFNFVHYEVPTKVKVKNCTGAGDTLCGAFVHALLQGKTESDAIRIGMNAALKSVLCENHTISPDV